MEEESEEDDPKYSPKPRSRNRTTKKPSNSSRRPLPTFYSAPDEDEQEQDSDDSDAVKGNTDDFEQAQSSGRRYPKRLKKKKKPFHYEFVPRSRMRGNPSDESDLAREWSEQDKFILLEVWGERFLQLRRNSMRSRDWAAVAKNVSEALEVERTEAECRQMMDSLKKRYRNEKSQSRSGKSKWAFYRKMDMLMRQENGKGFSSLSCGFDSGEYVFTDTGLYLKRGDEKDEMGDSPCGSEEEDGDVDGGVSEDMCRGLNVLAKSLDKFVEKYERIERNKSEQMLELERMRIDYQRELELEKQQILEVGLREIAKLRGDDNDGDDEATDTDSDKHSDRDVNGGGMETNEGGKEAGNVSGDDGNSGANVSG